MYIYDYRLSKILIDVRIQRAQAQRQTRAIARSSLRSRLGRLLIAAGERLAHGQTTTAEGDLSAPDGFGWTMNRMAANRL